MPKAQAFYRLETKILGRSDGRSAVGAAAYRAGEKFTDQRIGKVFDYSKKKKVDPENRIFAPKNSPDWVYNREKLWNEVEKSEKRIDSQVAREIILSIPKQIPTKFKKLLVQRFIQTQCLPHGMVADVNFHDLNSHNPHAHILLTTRSISEKGFGKKNRDWNKKQLLLEWRKGWEELTNRTFKACKINAEVDSRSLKEQGIDRLPQIHLGKAVIEMEKRGVKTRKGKIYRAIESENQAMEKTRQEISSLEKEVETLHSKLLALQKKQQEEEDRLFEESQKRIKEYLRPPVQTKGMLQNMLLNELAPKIVDTINKTKNYKQKFGSINIDVEMSNQILHIYRNEQKLAVAVFDKQKRRWKFIKQFSELKENDIAEVSDFYNQLVKEKNKIDSSTQKRDNTSNRIHDYSENKDRISQRSTQNPKTKHKKHSQDLDRD